MTKQITNAPCQTTDPELFFPDSTEYAKIKQAKALCNQCNSKQECLSFAMSIRADYGIWGGLTDQERRSLRRKLQRNKSNG